MVCMQTFHLLSVKIEISLSYTTYMGVVCTFICKLNADNFWVYVTSRGTFLSCNNYLPIGVRCLRGSSVRPVVGSIDHRILGFGFDPMHTPMIFGSYVRIKLIIACAAFRRAR